MGRSHRRGPGSPTSTSTGSQGSEKRHRGSGFDAHTAMSNEQVQELAREGVRSPGSELPYLDQLQACFGDYDVSSIRAHTDDRATSAIGANAYSLGGDIVFSGGPVSITTAAEEATHAFQQAAGKGPASGVGQEGDVHERQADEVAARVQAGKPVDDLLDRITGGDRSLKPGKATAVQREASPEQPAPIKRVSGKAMGRLVAAQMGINHTKQVLKYGAGNQEEALRATNFNSYFRMMAMRDARFWQASPEAMELARKYPQALTAAKARTAAGGNCGEHAQVAYDYLRQNLGGDKIQQVDVNGLDHAFIIIGEIGEEPDSELVVCDPWPTKPVACLWEDHFAYTPDPQQLNVRASALNDTADYAQQIFDGLTFTEEGQRYIQQRLTDEQVEEQFKKNEEMEHGWIWNHERTTARGKEFRYRMAPGVKADSSAYTGTMKDDVRAWLSRQRGGN